MEHLKVADRAHLCHDLIVGFELHCNGDDIRLYTHLDEIGRRAHRMRRRIRKAEEARISRHARIEAGRNIERERAAHRADQVVHDLAGCGVVRIQIEVLCLLVIRHMMVDVQHAHCIHGGNNIACTLQLDIADDE